MIEFFRCEPTLYPKTVSYVIAPTLNCNLKCVYCFERQYATNSSQSVLKEETIDKIISFIVTENSNNPNLKSIRINWFGGEPLLCYDTIILFSQKLLDILNNNGIRLLTSITTNGILLDTNKLKVLAHQCNLQRVQITIDGEEQSYCRKNKQLVQIISVFWRTFTMPPNMLKPSSD